jgi:hypothetical protein
LTSEITPSPLSRHPGPGGEPGGSGAHALSRDQLDKARAILDRERELTRLPWPARLLRGAVYLFGIAFVAFMVLQYFDSGDTPASFLLMVLAAAFVGIIVLFFVNLPYLRRLARQYRLMKSLGLLDALRSPWVEERRRSRVSNVLDIAIRLAAILPIVAFSAGGLVLASFLGSSQTSVVLLGFGVVAVTLIGLMAIFLDYRTRMKKSRLTLVARLSSTLSEAPGPASGATAEGVNIPEPAYAKLAEIERAQIAYGRMQSMLAVEEPRAYAVQKSRSALEAQADLEPATRLRVQDLIDSLAEEPRPDAATEDAGTGVRRLPVPGTAVAIVFSVDDAARRVRVHAFAPAGRQDTRPGPAHP